MVQSVPDSHRSHAPAASAIGCAVITVSDSKVEATDTSGRLLEELLSGAGFPVALRKIVRDDPPVIEESIGAALALESVRVVITSGGTGITSRDSTFEVVSGLLDKELTGFGELFRWLSFEEIGSAAMMSRATAGSCRGKILIALPGSPGAVRLALERLVVPELRHLVEQVSR